MSAYLRGRPSTYGSERPLDAVELQAVRAFQRALRTQDEAHRAAQRALTPAGKHHAVRVASAAEKIAKKTLAELVEVLLGGET